MNDGKATLDEAKDIYAARRPGWPGYVAVMVNDPKWAKETAKEMADWIKCGYEVVGLVTRSESARGMKEYMAEKEHRAKEPATAELPAGSLFGKVSEQIPKTSSLDCKRPGHLKDAATDECRTCAKEAHDAASIADLKRMRREAGECEECGHRHRNGDLCDTMTDYGPCNSDYRYCKCKVGVA